MNSNATKLENLKEAVLAKRLKERISAQTANAANPGIPAADRTQALPLSLAQKGLWFLTQFDPVASVSYNQPSALRMTGILHRDALRRTLDRVVARHESLRTSFVIVDGQPAQSIAPADVGFALHEQDLSSLDPLARQSAVQASIAAEAARPFDLAAGPLIRGLLLRLAEEEHVLLVTLHHIVSDGWSTGILVNEVRTLYTAFSQNLSDPLPPLPTQYADYAVWQRQSLQGANLQAQIDFWRAHLEGAPALLELPTDRPRPAAQSYAGGMQPLKLDAKLSAQLRGLSQRHGVTLFMTLLAAWSVLLARLSGQNDVVIGTPVANRQRAELESLIGFFINTLALRVRLDDKLDVTQLLAQVKATTLAAYANQDLPFEQVVEALQPTRSLAYNPIFQANLILDNTPGGGDLALPGLTLTPLEIPHSTTHYDLSLWLVDDGNEIVGGLEYASDLFDAPTVARITGHFATLLSSMAADPAQAVSTLPLLAPPERDQLLRQFNDTAIGYPHESLIHQLFEQQAAAQPDAIAVVYEEQSLCYGDLNRRANQLAHHLLKLGVRPDDRVAICVERSVDMIVGLLAILKAGGAYVPLDPGYPSERLAHMLADSAPVALLTQSRLADDLPGRRVPMIVLDGINDLAAINRQAATNPAVPGLGARHLAYIIYTSGSTGAAKGVMIEHRSAVNFWKVLESTTHTYCPKPARVALNASYSFDMSLKGILQLLSGHCVVIIPQLIRANGHALMDFFAANRIDAFDCTPSQLELLLAAGLIDDNAPYQPKSVLIGGEAISQAQWDKLKDAQAINFYNMYGPTEATIDATIGWLKELGDTPSIGRPIANAKIYILDAQRQPVPLGVAGEIHIAGHGLARGYLNRPELTAERFLADAFDSAPDARMYKTGDLARWLPEGNIEYLGRNDFQVKIRGFRIELGEIEAKLLACAGVREAVVLAREDQPGDKRLVAYFTAAEGCAPAAAELRDELALVLADYMVPAAFVALEAFPHTPNGKLDRNALPAPGQSAAATRTYAAPLGDIETTIAELWQDLLDIDRVGRHDHFFDLGGHSLLALQLISRLRQAFGAELTPRELFERPTLADMAELVASATGSDLVSIAPIAPAPRERSLPLSWMQQRLWFLDQFDPAAGAAYHVPGALRLRGKLLRAALQATMDRIVARHEILRTAFVSADGEPAQSIAPPDVGFALREQDLSTLDAVSRQAAMRQAIAHETAQPFDLATGPLIRGLLLRLADEEHVLMVTLHHIVSDGWSAGILVNEVRTLYTAFSQGLPDPMPPLPIQYADYAVWQRQSLQGAKLQTQIDFWRSHLEGAPALLELPTDRPRPAVRSYAGGMLPVRLDAKLCAQLRDLSQRHGVTLFMTLLAAWSALLARLCGQDDVVIGMSVANRQRTEVESLIGFFVNTLALRVRLDDQLDVAQLLAQVKATLLAAYAHQDLPFEQVVEALQPTRSLAHAPVFQVMLSLNNTPAGGALALPGLTLEPLEIPYDTSRFDLTMSLVESGDDIVGGLEYASDLFDTATVSRIAGHFTTLLSAMAADPAQAVDRLPLLTPPEREQLLTGFNNTAADYPSARLIHQLFEAQAAAQPDAVAVMHRDESLCYGELNRRANRLAHHLLSLGVRPDERVAICIERSIDMVVGILGVLKAGAGYIPLDPGHAPERLQYMLADGAPRVLITQSRLLASLPAFEDGAIVTIDDDEPYKTAPASNPRIAGLVPTSLAYVIYTSGSTGLPKGVMVEHGSVVNFLASMAQKPGLAGDDVMLAVTTLSFDIAGLELYLPLAQGARIVLAGQTDAAEPDALRRLMDQHAVSIMQATPSTWRMLLDSGWAGKPDLKALCGGEALPPALAERLIGKTAEAWNLYGPTETTIWSTVSRLASPQPSASVSIGRPIANTAIYILDRHLQAVPIGVAGEMFIGGTGLARGYLNRAELSAERFVFDPFSQTPGARMYRTGDMARWLPDGNIEYLGRNDFQVKIRGFRIELGEIEARLAACAGVRQAAVLAREDQPGDKRLVAYLVAEPGCAPGVADLRGALVRSLPEYMLPSAFVTMEAFPLTPNGKLDRRALPAPGQSAVLARTYVAPVDETEVAIARIWQELLGLPRIGRHDQFFELGGHSLLAVQLASRLRQTFGAEVSLRELFERPTVEGQAELVKSATRFDLAPIMPAPRERALPLSLMQQRLWFLDQLDPGAGAAYQIPGALRLRGKLHHAALRATLDRIVARHESLRTTFISVDGEPVQSIAPADVGFALQERDLSTPDPAQQQAAVQAAIAIEAARPFGLTTGPLIRGLLLRLAEEEHVLLVTQHHIISDGWSTGVLIGEMRALYTAFSQGLPDPLPPLPIQYADYAVWQRQSLQGAKLQAHIDFWRDHLQGAPALLELPTDRPRPAVQSYAGGVLPLTLDAALSDRLRNLSQQHGVTLFMTLLAAWGALLSRLCGQIDVVIGTPVANRQRTELEPLIGFFVNTLALRVRFDGEPDVAQLLAQVKATTLAAYAHQDLPFDQVVEAAQPARSLAHGPIFQSMLSLDNTPGKAPLALPGLTLEPVEIGRATTHFDLSLWLTDNGNEIAGGLEYASDLFDAASVARIAEHFTSLLTSMVADPAQAVSRLPLLPAAQRHQVLAGFNDTAVSYPQDLLIHQLFEAQVFRTPDAIALSFEGQNLSYAELNARANRLAHHLRGLGVAPDIRVAVCLERSVEMMVGLFAILKAGGAYVPLDPSYPHERLAYMLADSAPAAILAHGATTALLRRFDSSVPLIDLDDGAAWAAFSADNPAAADVGLTSHNLAYVIYTSGSTGQPKGVMNEHRPVVNRLLWGQDAYGLDADDVLLQKTPFSFDVSVPEFFWPLGCGARLVLARPLGHQDPEYLCEVMCRESVTTVHFVPSMLQLFLAHQDLGRCTSLRRLFCSGEALPVALVERFHAVSKNIALHNLYGPTEAAVEVTAWEYVPGTPLKSVPIGKPVPNTQAYVLDRHLQPVPIGVAGELYLGGVQVARGYLNREALTAERFIGDPFSATSGARLYKTGDVARWLPDGNIEYLGRNDFQVKIRGLRIELGEIEAALTACAGVREAVVLAREDQPGDKRLVAYVVAQGDAPSVAALRTELARTLAEHMLPSAFVMLDAFPLSPNGKLDRNALPAPDQSSVLARAYEAPQGEVETAIARLWQELLGVPRVGRHDQFFELGGHSLLVVRFIEKMRQARPEFAVSLQQFMKNPTVQGLAHSAQSYVGGSGGALVTGKAPILANNYWFLKRRDLNHWNSSMLLEPVIPYDPTVIRDALALLLGHHDALRAVWVEEASGWMQQFQAPEAMSPWWSVADLSHLPDEAVAAAIERRCEAIQSSLDITQVLFKAVYFDLGNTRPGRLMLAIHHLIIDGYSKAIFISDLERACAALAQGRKPDLPDKTTSVKATAEFLDQLAHGLDTYAELQYWRSQPWHRYRPLPQDGNLSELAPDTGIARHGVVFHALSAETTQRLESIPARLPGVTVEHMLITAILVAYEKWSGAKALCLNTVHHGRLWEKNPEIDLSRTIGWLANYSNCMHDISDCPALLDAVQAVGRQRDARKGKEALFTLMRYVHRDESVRSEMASFPEHQFEFNFIPRQASAYERDAAIAEESETRATGFKHAGENFGTDDGPMHSGFAPFSKAYFDDGCLKFYWVYCKTAHTEKTFAAFAAENASAIHDIVEAMENEIEILQE